ncbi:MAG: pitrilysin family protein [Candidatus Saccharimonadales bacterium]
MKHTVTEIKAKNGARGLLIHIPDASVMTFDFNFRAGEYLVERDIWETPHLMEHLLLGANELIPKARTFQAEFEKNGAYSNASTGSYDITYEAECADFEWDRVLGLLLTAITKPLFLADEFEAEFGNVREELNARSNSHFRHLSLALREEYGFKVVTDQERLLLMKNVTLKDINHHYKRTHTSSNLRFVIAGNLSNDRRAAVKSLISSIELPEGDGRQPLPVEKPRRLEKPLYINNATVDNIYFYLDTFKQRRLSDPEADALGLLNTMLTETLYSRILGTAREKGLVYSMSSGHSQLIDSSNWWFGAQVMPANAEALFKIITKELNAVFRADLADEDVQAAKQYAIGRYQRGAQTAAGISSGYAYRYFFDDEIEDYYQVPNRIKAITKNRIIKVANTMFEDDTWGLGCLSSAGQEFADKLYGQAKGLWR